MFSLIIKFRKLTFQHQHNCQDKNNQYNLHFDVESFFDVCVCDPSLSKLKQILQLNNNTYATEIIIETRSNNIELYPEVDKYK